MAFCGQHSGTAVLMTPLVMAGLMVALAVAALMVGCCCGVDNSTGEVAALVMVVVGEFPDCI